jgi:hypothetical protein
MSACHSSICDHLTSHCARRGRREGRWPLGRKTNLHRKRVVEGFTLAVRCMQRTRHEYKKAARRMHHHLPTALPSLSAARILTPPHPHCVSAGKQRRRGFFVVMPSSGCPTFGLSFSRGDFTMRRASVETVDHRAASAASGRLESRHRSTQFP